MDLIIEFTIFSIIAAWLLYRWRTRASISLAFKVPSNRLHTWLGFGPIKNSKTVQYYLHDYAEKYGPNSVCWMGPLPIFLTSDPKTIKDILKSKNCINKPHTIYMDLALTFGDGLVTQSDPMWSKNRRIFDKAFNSKILMSYIPVFHNEIFHTINRIDKMLELKEPIDLLQIFKENTASIGMKTTLKRDCEKTTYKLHEVVANLNSILTYVAEVSFNVLYKVNILRYLADIFVHREARQAINKFQGVIKEIIINNDITNPSYLPDIVTSLDYGIMALKQNLLTTEELVNQFSHIFSASFETIASSLYFVISILAMHPECQDKVYNEVTSVFSTDDEDAMLSYEQINQLIYLEMVLNETMRVIPSVCLVARTVSNESLKLSNGVVLPVGQIISIDIHRLHRSKAVYGPAADRFNPENFSSENIKQRHPYAFIPFTKGERFCIGQRFAYLLTKIFLAQLIRKYRFDTDFKFEDLRVLNRITTHLVEEPVVRIEKREA